MELTHVTVRDLLARLGPGNGHVYLPHGFDPQVLTKLLADAYGTPRTLVLDGFTDPTVDESRGAALLAPFGDRAVKIRAWAYGNRWIGTGTARNEEGTELPVLVVAGREVPVSPQVASVEDGEDGEDGDWLRRLAAVHREVPALTRASGTGGGVDWSRRLVEITGWTRPARRPDVDWAETESRLGTALPGDYKRMVETFGEGAFDGEMQLLQEPWTHPREEGLLTWAGSDQEEAYCWRTVGGDPDRWPVVVRSSDGLDTHFDCGAAELVCRVLLDPHHPYTLARYYGTPWFMPFMPCPDLP
ncbi:hypothetical protein [Streptomyces chilikensis]|uniref:SMI1/KNR4 family protein n=1 Tax=Streptomyces chilikensis TaxID=1194079 RepID=A0ABV3EKM8_9ACTN